MLYARNSFWEKLMFYLIENTIFWVLRTKKSWYPQCKMERDKRQYQKHEKQTFEIVMLCSKARLGYRNLASKLHKMAHIGAFSVLWCSYRFSDSILQDVYLISHPFSAPFAITFPENVFVFANLHFLLHSAFHNTDRFQISCRLAHLPTHVLSTLKCNK